MTTYHGGKKRIGAEIAREIRNVADDIFEEDGIKYEGYCEPFAGMCGVYQHIPELFEDYSSSFKYIAGDRNESVIKMWNRAKRGWKPPTTCTKVHFMELRGNGRSSAEKGFIGHACGFRGKYFVTWKTHGQNLDHQSQNVSRLAKGPLRNVKFTTCDYTQFSLLENHIIYCDPPYLSSSQYLNERNVRCRFDNDAFMEWTENMTRQNNLVFMSERAPVPSATQLLTMREGEKLYLVNDIYD